MLYSLGFSPLPGNTLVEQNYVALPFGSSYVPAPLDEISMVNGVLKFDHPQSSIEGRNRQYLKDRMVAELGHLFARGHLLDNEEIPSWIVPDSSSGWPYTLDVATQKGDVVEKLGIDRLISDFNNNTQVLSATLKMELRKPGKDARLFRPAPISSVCAAIRLFGLQNVALMSDPWVTHIALGLSTPGVGIATLWNILSKVGGPFKSADGSQWDAHFPLWAAELICEVRMMYSDDPDMVYRYYQQMYNGVTNIFGNGYKLIGNPSGHFNTSIDNCLLQIMMMWMVELEYNQTGSFFVCGDDLITAGYDLTDDQFNRVYNKYGLYLEFEDKDSTPFYKLVFIGTHPVFKDRITYTYDEDSQLSSLCYRDVRGTLMDYFSKCSSIAMNLYHSSSYHIIRKIMDQLIKSYQLEGRTVQSVYIASSSLVLNAMYLGIEVARPYFF